MFDKGKQLLEMRKQAKELQKQLAKITSSVEHKGIKVKVSGDQQVLYIEVDGEERKDITDAINKAFKDVQKDAAKEMMKSGGGLGGMLGGM